jgi:phage terminase large subunit
MAVVTIPYKPRNWARRFHAELTRFAALVLHRRAGKTTALMNQHLRAAMDDQWERQRLLRVRPSLTHAELAELIHPPGGRHYGHVMPTRVQAKMVVWDKLKFYAAGIPGIKPNESELLLRLPTGHKIQLFGADDPDSLRGFGPSGISFDEFSQQPANIFSEVISKALGDHMGYAIFAGTIKGKDHLYRTWDATKADMGWFSLWQDIDTSLKTEDGITIQLLEQAMEDDRKQIAQGLMTQDEYDQEWYLSPEAAIKGAIYGKELTAARTDGRITTVPHDPSLPVNTYWDLGMNMAIWFEQSTRSGEVRCIDYYESGGKSDLPECIQVLRSKPYTYGRHVAPHDIEVTELASGRTRRESARSLGINFEVAPKIGIEDGINAAKLIMARTWFDSTKCAAGLEALRNYRRDYNQRLNEFKDAPLHNWASHGSDAYRYLAVSHRPAKEAKRPNYGPSQPVRGEYSWAN